MYLLLVFGLSASPALAAAITVSSGQSIQSAVSAAGPGDTIVVDAGTYNERVSINKTNITLRAGGKVNTKAVTVTGSGNTVSGLTISDAGANAGITVKGNNNLFENNEIFHTGQDGVWFFGSGNTFRGNSIHDILDPTISGDPHVDCFQTWGWNWDTYNVLFENNTCDHTRSTGSNQIVMLSRSTASQVRDITFRNNLFIMHDAGYSPVNLVRKAGQGEISGLRVVDNTIVNTTGAGQDAVRMLDITNGTIQGNQVYGYKNVSDVTGGSVTQSANALFPISQYKPGTTTSPPLTPPTPTASAANAKAGDANGDGRVNGVDYVVWVNHYNQSILGASNGDFNNSGIVDGVDYVIWANSYGK